MEESQAKKPGARVRRHYIAPLVDAQGVNEGNAAPMHVWRPIASVVVQSTYFLVDQRGAFGWWRSLLLFVRKGTQKLFRMGSFRNHHGIFICFLASNV